MIIRIRVLLCVFSISACFLASAVGHEAIINGVITKVINFPYAISLQYPEHRHACSGGLIRNRFVLTAAHCVVVQNGDFVGGKINVVARADDLIVCLPPAVTVEVKRMYALKEYNPRDGNHTADIAVLELRKEIINLQRSDNTHWLELSRNKHEDTARGSVSITGYGWKWAVPGRRNRLIGDNDGFLRTARANVLMNSACQDAYPHLLIQHEKYICAKMESLIFAAYGVCNGDNGGLLVRDSENATAVVIGVLSKRSPQCDERTNPAIYTRVSHFHEFIENAVAGRLTENMRMHEVPIAEIYE